MTQLVVRVPDDLAVELDRLVEAGVADSRSEAVRQALEQLLARHRRAQIAGSIIAGYETVPDDGSLWSDRATVAMIEEEPW